MLHTAISVPGRSVGPGIDDAFRVLQAEIIRLAADRKVALASGDYETSGTIRERIVGLVIVRSEMRRLFGSRR